MCTTTSNSDTAESYASALESQLEVSDLAGVDDDNTLAESGVYATAWDLIDAMRSLVEAANADAEAIRSAAAAFDSWDESQAGSY